MNFIKRCWDEIGSEFTAAVMGFFQMARLPADANITWVALAPKFMGAKEIKDLRPISMVGCMYKVISKVLVRRMRSVMPALVGETQSAFVQGRKIHDGALIACETVSWLKLRKKEAALIKLDFQKAYDRVKWSFVNTVLQKMGFGHKWRAWVMECVATASMSVLINGSPSKPFNMERGLRQGDPLSPFLFVLVVDVLHRMIGEAVRNGRISPLLVGRDSIPLSHLQFADDTILFCPPKEETIRNYKRLMRFFELMSGLSINFDKSSLIPINCEEQWVERMCNLLGCKGDVLPVKYLRISLGANPRLVKTWKPIIDKVEEKLSLWKAKVLNKSGKLVLIKSVLNSLPIYYLSLFKMLKAVAEKLISLQRRFLWSSEEGRTGMALIRWEVVQAPKKLGGLGVGNAMVRNTALLFKWWWRFAKEDCPLWKKVVASCHNLNPNEPLWTQEPPTRGGPWKDICQLHILNQHLRDKMVAGLSMVVGNGCQTRFWEDTWVLGGSLKNRFPRLFSVSNQCGSVMQEELIPEEVISYSFTRTIWKGLVPPRVELFVWFALIGRVNTKDRLSQFGIISHEDVTCVLCNNGVEDVHHLFLGCIFAWQLGPLGSSGSTQRGAGAGKLGAEAGRVEYLALKSAVARARRTGAGNQWLNRGSHGLENCGTVVTGVPAWAPVKDGGCCDTGVVGSVVAAAVPEESDDGRSGGFEGADNLGFRTENGYGDNGVVGGKNGGSGELNDDGNFGDVDGYNDSNEDNNTVSETEDKNWANNKLEDVDAVKVSDESKVCQRTMVKGGDGVGSTQIGKVGDENDGDMGDNQSATFEEQMLENKRT
nr:uncharacterized protein LOC114925208 [Arachis hypogaea]